MADRVRRVALTGGIASGKTHVRAKFEAAGVPTIDADVLARQAVEPGSAGLHEVIRRFGEDVRDPSGGLDRKKMATIVFTDAAARHMLEAIIHPYVRAATNAWFGGLDPRRHRFAIADIPLLFEAGRDIEFEKIVVAACDPETQLQRLMARDGLSEEAAHKRIAAQWPLADKIARADYVIRTDGSFDDTNREVDAVLAELRSWSTTDQEHPRPR